MRWPPPSIPCRPCGPDPAATRRRQSLPSVPHAADRRSSWCQGRATPVAVSLDGSLTCCFVAHLRSDCTLIPAVEWLGVHWLEGTCLMPDDDITIEVNGREADQAAVSLLDHEGWGHFTAMQVRGGRR